MSLDVVDLRNFYSSPLGTVARRLVSKAVERIWPDVRGQNVLGFGYPTPYLASLRASADRVVAFMPATQGVTHWPRQGPSATALVSRGALPLQIGSVDRVILAHALETTDSPLALMEEIWRVLTPGGRVIVIVPNRRGLWARMDSTPFGHGQPFSRSQLTALMQQSLFAPETWSEALYIPPVPRRLALRSAVAFERIGAGLSLPFAGVHVMEAVKQLYRPISVPRPVRAVRLSPVMAPVPSTRAATSEPSSTLRTPTPTQTSPHTTA
ncbi:class I SAM-dependent methyltransferase [Pseudochelatococcus contaminans]|uniref:class I SAM-dependent methyltransferase n=1 Tax=Pseudochelatococcus contaminans TaxID=1538103 RepID=UPI001618C84D|nr:methyltransferase domain-containing protein [Pseudochelatococcus contaminans]